MLFLLPLLSFPWIGLDLCLRSSFLAVSPTSCDQHMSAFVNSISVHFDMHKGSDGKMAKKFLLSEIEPTILVQNLFLHDVSKIFPLVAFFLQASIIYITFW